MIVMIGPRLTDPRSKVDFFLGLFRFSEEKEKVQEILKARAHVMSSNLFRQPGLSIGAGAGADCSPMSVTSEGPAKPIFGIKGMGGARERVTKPFVKPRALDFISPDSSILSIAPSTPIAPPPAPRTESKWATVGSTPTLQTATVISPIKAPVVKEKPADCSVVMKEPHSTVPYTYNKHPATTSAANSKPAVDIGESEFASLGGVQRMIKTYSAAKNVNAEPVVNNCPPKIGAVAQKTKVTTFATAHVKSSEHGTSNHPIVLLEPPADKNQSLITRLLDDDGLSSECTSVEESEGQESEDSVRTWRQTRLRSDSKGVTREINRLSFERKKMVFSNSGSPCQSTGELSECSTFDSCLKSEDDRITRKDSDHSINKASSKPSSKSPRRKSANRNSVTKSKSPEADLRRKMRRDSSQAVATSTTCTATASGKVKDLTLYKSMPSEGPVGTDRQGTSLFRYYELVRMNFVKKYEGVNQAELVYAMVDDEFLEHFGMSKVSQHVMNMQDEMDVLCGCKTSH